jgi:hypothetical protein
MATIEWRRGTGAASGTDPTTGTTITHLKNKTKDEATNDTNYSIPIPSALYNYSFWETIYAYATALSEVLSNFKIYGGGVPSGYTGVILHIGDEQSDTYIQATGTESETGLEIVDNHSQVTSKTDFLATYTSGNKKAIALAGGVASIIGVGRVTKYIFFQMRVTITATHGALANYSIVGQYDLA